MESYIKTAIPAVESNYSNFTAVERTIADYFIRNQKKEDFAAKAVAERLFVSEASLSRFAKKCGFRGYREFLYQYEQGFGEKFLSVTGNTQTVLDVYQELLNKTYSLVDEPQIARISKYLNHAGRVLICGKGSSGLAAREMEMRLMRIGVDVDSVCDTDMMRMRAVFQDKHSLVFGISVSGGSKEVLYLLRESHRRGAKTVLLTANSREEYNEYCDEVLLIPSLCHLENGSVISPQFPVLVMADIIYSYYAHTDSDQKEMLHDHTLRALESGRRRDFA